jgi:hypothetical protein
MLNDLKDIISNFANSEIIFSNEEQFQFLLAIELNKKGYNVSLEVLSMDNTEKMYTDIVVKNDDGSYTAIELKYKLQEKNLVYTTKTSHTYHTFKQGANNNGRYAYLQDVERLERLIHNRVITSDPTHEKITFNFDHRKKVKKGYAIIISNDQNYWTSTSGLSSNFSLEDGITISSGTHGWKIKLNSSGLWISGKTVDGEYHKIITVDKADLRNNYMSQKNNKTNLDYVILDNDYYCKWEAYEPNIVSCRDYNSKKQINKNYEFKYLILEVN